MMVLQIFAREDFAILQPLNVSRSLKPLAPCQAAARMRDMDYQIPLTLVIDVEALGHA